MRRVMYKNEKERFLLRQETLKEVKKWIRDINREHHCPLKHQCFFSKKYNKEICCFMWFNEIPTKTTKKGNTICPCGIIGDREVSLWVIWQIFQDKDYLDQ